MIDEQKIETDPKQVVEQWKTVIATQMHFNDLIMRTRTLLTSVVLAAYGASAIAFSQYSEKFIVTVFGFIHVSIAICLFAISLLVSFFVVDFFYLSKLLMASVELGMKIEKDYRLPIKQTTWIFNAVSSTRAFVSLGIFYGLPLGIGGLFLWYVFKYHQPWLGP